MSRFNSAAYDKLFPRPVHTDPAPESAVDTFTPTKNKMEGKDPDVTDPAPDQIPEDPEPENVGGDPDGDGSDSKPDTEQ